MSVSVRGREVLPQIYIYKWSTGRGAEENGPNRVSRTSTWSLGRLLEASELMGWLRGKKRVPEELTRRGLACVERSSNSQTRESASGFRTAEWRIQDRVCKYKVESRGVQLVKIRCLSLTKRALGGTASFWEREYQVQNNILRKWFLLLWQFAVKREACVHNSVTILKWCFCVCFSVLEVLLQMIPETLLWGSFYYSHFT